MHIDFLLHDFHLNADRTAMVWKDTSYSYQWLIEQTDFMKRELINNEIKSGAVVALKADFTPNTLALLLALTENANIIVPLADATGSAVESKIEIAQVEKIIIVDTDDDRYSFTSFARRADHCLYDILRKNNVPGLVLFTSGSSGTPKAAVHDFSKLLNKFKTKRKALRTVNFLLYDHWGGLNTLLHTLSNCGVVLATRNRQPDDICRFIEKYNIELLPVSPTFLNLLIISQAYSQYDLSSLKIITYGTEPMPQATLQRAKEIFPEVTFQQTYGLIELGVLRSKSRSDDSLWVKVGGEGFQTRVVDDVLQIKADSAMLGYLNAESPFTDDGYFITGDYVQQEGDYIKILGRKSELINVGGDKVYPQEVENVIMQFPNVIEVMVYGEKNALVGNIVCAKISFISISDRKQMAIDLKSFCGTKLEKFKVPVKVIIAEGPLHTDRYKKDRQSVNG